MHSIFARNISISFNNVTVIKDFSYQFFSDNIYGIIGRNGSGKSTLVKLLSSYLTPENGSIEHCINQKQVNPSVVYKHISFASPYLILPEDFTIKEIFYYQSKLKPFLLDNFNDLYELAGLSEHNEKKIKTLSSGLLNRLKISLSLLSVASFVFLDEPLSNLDTNGNQWFQNLLNNFRHNKLIIIASNSNENEISLSNSIISMDNY